jgi:hypothetical protein
MQKLSIELNSLSYAYRITSAFTNDSFKLFSIRGNVSCTQRMQ